MMHRIGPWAGGALAGACVILVTGGEARADDAPSDVDRASEAPGGFAAPGRVVLGNVFGLSEVFGANLGSPALSAGWVTYGASTSRVDGGEQTSKGLSFAPEVDVFVAHGISVGGSVVLDHLETHATSSDGTASDFTSNEAGAHPRFGWAGRLTDGVFVWPRLALGVAYAVTSPDAHHAIGLDGTFDVPVVVELGRHAVIATGPTLTVWNDEPVGDGPAAHGASLGFQGNLALVF